MIYRGKTANRRWEVYGMRLVCMSQGGGDSSGEVRRCCGRIVNVSCISVTVHLVYGCSVSLATVSSFTRIALPVVVRSFIIHSTLMQAPQHLSQSPHTTNLLQQTHTSSAQDTRSSSCSAVSSREREALCERISPSHCLCRRHSTPHQVGQ